MNPLPIVRVVRRRTEYNLLLLSFVIAGCLPYSCNQTESRAIFPADSLARALAASLPADTLEFVDSLRPKDPRLSYPRNLAYAPDNTLWVTDTKVHTVTGFAPSGKVVKSLRFKDLEYPYIVGFRHGIAADTLVVFTPSDPRIVLIVGDELVRDIPLPAERPSDGGFQYVASDPGGYFYKVIGESFSGYIARLDRIGREQGRLGLNGPFWRYAGALRMWSDSLMSFSGYLPQIHLLHRSDRTAPISDLDSLTLHGFDSPMLSRTRLFIMDAINQPPLLSAAAVSSDDLLFFLNMRPGWLRVDVYDHAGELKYILTQPSPEFNTEYFPIDIAARKLDAHEARELPGTGTAYELAVSVVKPEARIDRFRWRQ